MTTLARPDLLEARRRWADGEHPRDLAAAYGAELTHEFCSDLICDVGESADFYSHCANCYAHAPAPDARRQFIRIEPWTVFCDWSCVAEFAALGMAMAAGIEDVREPAARWLDQLAASIRAHPPRPW
jgi:hypothetical protein